MVWSGAFCLDDFGDFWQYPPHRGVSKLKTRVLIFLKLIIKFLYMNVRPLGDKVVVKPLSKEEVTASGIIIPDTVDKERPEQGEVVAVGPGKFEHGALVPMNLKVGDKIVFKKYGPDEIEVDDEEVLVISESDILAVLE